MPNKLVGYGIVGADYDFFVYSADNPAMIYNFSTNQYEGFSGADPTIYRVNANPNGMPGRFVADAPAGAGPWEMRSRDGTIEGSVLVDHGNIRPDVNVIAVGGVTANPTSEGTKFDGVTAGGSTFTRVMLAEAYDVAKELEYVGANLIVDGYIEAGAPDNPHGIPRPIIGYGSPGSGASYVDIDPALPYEVELSAGLAARIVAGTVASGGSGGGTTVNEDETITFEEIRYT